MNLARRVAARHVLAAFIPDKFFKDYEVEFKRLAAEPIPHGLPTAIYLMKANVMPLIKKFRAEVIGLAPVSQPAIDALVRVCLLSVTKTCQAYFDSAGAVDYRWPKSPLECVMGHIGEFANAKISKDVKTLGRALKTPIIIDPSKVGTLASRALKEATPEEVAALTLHQSPVAAAFYADHVDGSIPRLIKKGKVDLDLVKWVGIVRTTLSNYATENGRYLEFDLNGMKVVIDDWSVTPEEHDNYVKYLDSAYHKLKAKRLSHAWYGMVYIECDTCGGVNRSTGGDVGGHYNIEEDHVKIFSRAGPFIVELMAHELGHRYWFKSMSQSQRAKFEALVLIRHGERPGGERKLLDPEQVEDAQDNVGSYRVQLLYRIELLERDLTSGKITALEAGTKMAGFRSEVEEYSDFVLRPTRDLDAKGESLYKDVRQAVGVARTQLAITPPSASYTDPDGPRVWKAWFEECRVSVVAAGIAADRCLKYVLKSFEDREKRNRTPEQVAWDEDPRVILPVSEYGKTNIDEAFAEAFMLYVMGTKMDADQEASFKAVLLDKDRMASKVAERWLNSVS